MVAESQAKPVDPQAKQASPVPGSSRIIVKNLPKHLSTQRLREHFAEHGSVSDAKIMFTASGKNRCFGFVGFHTEKEARDAVKHFNDTFIDTSRISVELAKALGDVSLPRAWSKYTQRESFPDSNVQGFTVEKKDEQREDHVNAVTPVDARLRDFLEVMKPRSQVKIWQNDDVSARMDGGVVDTINVDSVAPARPGIVDADDGLYEDLPSKAGASVSNVAISANTESCAGKPVQERKTSAACDEIAIAESTCDVSAPVIAKDPIMNPDEAAIDTLLETGRIFVRNLSYQCTEKDLDDLFCKYGPLAEVHAPTDTETKNIKGFAFVLFVLPEHAVKAYRELDGTIFQGRVLHLLPAKEKPSQVAHDEDKSKSTSYRDKKKAELKAKAGESYTWNSLFMSADAVAESMASKLDVAKRDILDLEAGNMAVRLALAETHVIQETIDYLKEEGVFVDAFKERDCKRSDTVILVKNVPFSIDESDIHSMFGVHGNVTRVVLPPTRTIALVEFASSSEARASFKALAYRNFKGRPLLLEKAPALVFNGRTPESASDSISMKISSPPGSITTSSKTLTPTTRDVLKEPTTTTVNDADDAAADQTVTTIYVKNLNFSTTAESFTSLFASVPGFRSAKISTKRDPKNPKGMLSMGFGFVEFDTPQNARFAMKTLQGVQLDGHSLLVKLSGRSPTVAATSADHRKATSAKIKACSKILVRNVPFEATKKELVDLFGSFGHLKRVRMPTKFDNKSHRGFAFVDFTTKEEAKAALESLSNSHLYGRKLVLEFSTESQEGVDAMREKTKRYYSSGGGDGDTAKRIKSLGEDEDGMDGNESG